MLVWVQSMVQCVCTDVLGTHAYTVVSVGPTALDSTNRGWEIHREKTASGLNLYRLFFLVIIP